MKIAILFLIAIILISGCTKKTYHGSFEDFAEDCKADGNSPDYYFCDKQNRTKLSAVRCFDMSGDDYTYIVGDCACVKNEWIKTISGALSVGRLKCLEVSP